MRRNVVRRFMVKARLPEPERATDDGFGVATSDPEQLLGVKIQRRRMALRAAAPEPGFMAGAPAAPEQAAWHLIAPRNAADSDRWSGLNAWELAHRLREELERSGVKPEAVEPDILQDYTYKGPRKPAMAPRFGGAGGAGDQDFGEPVSSAPPFGEDYTFGWHLGEDHSGLQSARQLVGDHPERVVIAHLDTGYDPNHVMAPTHVSIADQRNFVDSPDQLADGLPVAFDRADRGDENDDNWIESSGHGTATLALLAGGAMDNIRPPEQVSDRELGGVPAATVVPIRVANFVAQFYASSIAEGLQHAANIKADVVSMSLGGLPSQAWAEAVNRCYLQGMTIVAAAGNNFSGLPARQLVWPARFARVIAACGAMFDHSAYDDLGLGVMTGNYGPNSRMRTAMSAYTPNVPWAIFESENALAWDGAGTSSATPQIAAAAALWLMRWSQACEERGLIGWRRVEAVRRALFASAHRPSDVAVDPKLGNGILRAAKAMELAPMEAASYALSEAAETGWSTLWSIIGFGAGAEPAADPRLTMLRTELLQAAYRSRQVAEAVPELEAAQASDLGRIREILLEDDNVSVSLRNWLSGRDGTATVRRAALRGTETKAEVKDAGPEAAGAVAAASRGAMHSIQPVPPPPKVRRLRIYSGDPADALALDTAEHAVTVVEVPWEPKRRARTLLPGPVGEYIEVVDLDPGARKYHEPVALDDRNLLATDGLEPSVGNAKFHQQMVYAVAMRTIDVFEQALGRAALWAQEPRYWQKERYKLACASRRGRLAAGFVRRLRIYPHALRGQKNAFYSPQRVALLFGYFDSGIKLPDGRRRVVDTVYTCLSHDIIAHETTHALLDGLHPRFRRPSNGDVHAFHEGFADIVAIFQHFALDGVLREEIRKARGRLSKTRLGQLARQFGRARHGTQALRDAIGSDPHKVNYYTQTKSHDRGAVLVAAVFDAFMRIFDREINDLMITSTGGSGVHPVGELHPVLVDMLARKARKVADRVLHICIRALDYMPPVDPTFSDYLRALVTADSDIVPDDSRRYRVALIESMAERYIFPNEVLASTTEALRWRGPQGIEPAGLAGEIAKLPLAWSRDTDRLEAYISMRECAVRLHAWICENIGVEAGKVLGLDMNILKQPTPDAPEHGQTKFEVHSVRPAVRTSPDGRISRSIIVVLTQSSEQKIDPSKPFSPANTFRYHSGSTIIVDADEEPRHQLGPRRHHDPDGDDDGRRRPAGGTIRYIIRKSPAPAPEDRIEGSRVDRTRAFAVGGYGGLRALYFGDGDVNDQPFAMLHGGFDE